jgi:hypothetical protein
MQSHRVASWVAHTLAMASLSLAACSAQVDSDYRGEWLGGLRLALRASPNDVVPSDTAVGLVWDLVDPEGYVLGSQFGELIDVTGEAPFDVELDLSQPPPEPLLIEMADGNALAVARVRWLDRQGFNPVTGTTYSEWGGAHEHAVVFIAQDVVAEGATSRFLHGTTSAGYHLVRIDWPPPPTSCSLSSTLDERGFWRRTGDCPRNALTVAPDDLSTTVVVTPGSDDLVYEEVETAW